VTDFPNLIELLDELGVARLSPQTGWGRVRWSWGKLGYPGERYARNDTTPYTWDELVAAHGDQWVRVSAGQQSTWVHAKHAARFAEHTLGGKKIKVVPGRPCEGSTSHDVWHSSTCLRVGVDERASGNGWNEGGAMLWLCKMHVNGKDKSKASADDHKAKWAARDERDERARQTTKRAQEAIEACRPILEQIGIHPDTITTGASGERRGVLIPAEVLELFIANTTELEALKEDLGL
jgi:hypothetical protein